jgi:hypothetical protein
MSTLAIRAPRTPWHLWVVGIVSLLWNGSGTVTIMLAQAGRLPGVSPDEAAYYAAQPTWFVLVTDVALLAAVAAAVALLLRKKAAAALFALSLIVVLMTNTYELAAGTSRVLEERGAAVFNLVIAAIAVLQLVYAWAMRKRGVLR